MGGGQVMSKYVYCALLEPEEGKFNVSFPDLEDCYTCGDDLQDALKMAHDALASYLTWQEDHHRDIPEATNPQKIKVPKNTIQTLIDVDTEIYRKVLSNRSVKKTLTIPEWMDEKGKAKGINFSKVLQDALERELATV